MSGIIQPLENGEENEFVLSPEARGAWVDVDNLTVHIIRTDEGVVVDIHPNPMKEEIEPIASTYAFFNEATEENVQER